MDGAIPASGRLEYAEVVGVEPVVEREKLYATVIGTDPVRESSTTSTPQPVSYTHLDVYKRQPLYRITMRIVRTSVPHLQ